MKGDIHGASLLYTLMPIEMDANAAGAHFVMQRYGRDRIVARLNAEDRDSAALRSNVGPEPIRTLPERMVAFMIANRGLCELWAQQHGNGLMFRAFLDAAWPGAGGVWRDLVDDGGLALAR